MEYLKKKLTFFLTCVWNLVLAFQDLDAVRSTSDEMELAAHVSRKFKSTFLKQEEQKTFPTYDKLEVSQHTNANTKVIMININIASLDHK